MRFVREGLSVIESAGNVWFWGLWGGRARLVVVGELDGFAVAGLSPGAWRGGPAGAAPQPSASAERACRHRSSTVGTCQGRVEPAPGWPARHDGHRGLLQTIERAALPPGG